MLYLHAGNLFNAQSTFSLAQCISRDTNVGMFRGISVSFLEKYPELETLRSTNVTLGTAEPVKVGKIFIYNLITKPTFRSKPLLPTLKSALISMREHATTHGVADIAAPLLGCGCDKLQFENDVYPILKDIFGTHHINLYVYSLHGFQEHSQVTRYYSCIFENLN